MKKSEKDILAIPGVRAATEEDYAESWPQSAKDIAEQVDRQMLEEVEAKIAELAKDDPAKRHFIPCSRALGKSTDIARKLVEVFSMGCSAPTKCTICTENLSSECTHYVKPNIDTISEFSFSVVPRDQAVDIHAVLHSQIETIKLNLVVGDGEEKDDS